MELEEIQKLLKPANTKILFLVMDGLGGLPREAGGETELETARTPNLDALAAEGVCGLHQPVAPGITPGSGPAHLALFGYDPQRYQIGRGVLEALGIDFDLKPGDVAARGNFCTLDEQGHVVDRRAGRISTELNQALCERLRSIELPGVEAFVQPVKEHRLLFVLRGENLSGEVSDTDPQATGVEPLPPVALSPEAEKTAGLVADFLDQARAALKDQHPANMVLLRGFSQRPDWPLVSEVFGLKAAAVAAYPMYRGVGRLLGMQPIPTGETLEAEVRTVEDRWQDFDFFFLHVKPTDSAGEDGDFDRKAAEIEAVDGFIPRLRALEPDVIVVTGDHSTPSILKAHSWHPVPVLVWSRTCRTDGVTRFGERACMSGGLGSAISAPALMPIALANALRLEKFGA